MKKKYVVPQLDIFALTADVITSSNSLNLGEDWTPDQEGKESIDTWLK